MADQSFIQYFFNASVLVKGVMIILLLASITSWTLIVQRAWFFKRLQSGAKAFESIFWGSSDLGKMYSDYHKHQAQLEGMETIFHAGFREFTRLRKEPNCSSDHILEGAQRAMRIAYAREMDQMELHLSFLATVGSISPYVGLFGTVWGILTSLHDLSQGQQATIAMVAPGISEALIATAMGLFAAIPAVVAYNRFTNTLDRLSNQYTTFMEEFSNILYRLTVKPAGVPSHDDDLTA